MKIKLIFILLVSIKLSAQESPEYRPVPYTQKDRDMLIELKVKVEEMEKRNEQRFQEMEKRNEQRFQETNKRVDDLKDMILWQGGILVTLIVALFGYIVWDRRTFMKPLERDVQEVKYKIEQLEKHNEVSQSFWKALRELAKTDEPLKQVLKQYNLL
ncbi:MAG: hypothetical protein Fur0023_15030 [Bacteroidia bacterium]